MAGGAGAWHSECEGGTTHISPAFRASPPSAPTGSLAVSELATPTEVAPSPPRTQVSLRAILLTFGQIGLVAFGMAILEKLKAAVRSNGWLSDLEINDGLALVQLYPGPILLDFTAYVGYKLRGVPGALA